MDSTDASTTEGDQQTSESYEAIVLDDEPYADTDGEGGDSEAAGDSSSSSNYVTSVLAATGDTRQAGGPEGGSASSNYVTSITSIRGGAATEASAPREGATDDEPEGGTMMELDDRLGDFSTREAWLDTTDAAWSSNDAYEAVPDASDEPEEPDWQGSKLYVSARRQAALEGAEQERLEHEVGQGMEQSEVKVYGELFGDEAMKDQDYQSAGLSPDQKAELEERLRTGNLQSQERDEVLTYGELTGDETMRDPEYQSAGLSPDQRTELYERLAAAQEREKRQWQEQEDVRSYGALSDDPAMLDPDYQSAGLSPRQMEELEAAREREAQEERDEAARLQAQREELDRTLGRGTAGR